ncbi:hypothetical protein [Streptomyces radiopugnans]|uniref:hypothetical protein n=1 Tax=Streptomyces radiopugnans TaxID=403935 RepID=UPI003F1DF5BA
MMLKKTLAVSFTAALALAGGAASAHAGEAKFKNDSQILSCDVIEVIDIPILSSANNNIDCSENYKKEVHVKKVTKVEKEAKIIVAPEQKQLQGQGQGQETEQGQKQAGEQDLRNKNEQGQKQAGEQDLRNKNHLDD